MGTARSPGTSVVASGRWSPSRDEGALACSGGAPEGPCYYSMKMLEMKPVVVGPLLAEPKLKGRNYC